MIIGVPTEIKPRENRFGINPGGVQSLVKAGHVVKVQAGAGVGSGVPDAELTEVGATIVPTAADAWDADMVMKVKEPLQPEFQYFRPGLILYTYLHLAPLPELTRELMDKKVRAIAYETIEGPDGSLPLLRPMSEVAGRMAVQVGAASLEKERGGKGILLGGVPGTRRGRVAILGGGIVGANAAQIAVGMGAHVTVLDVNHERMAYLEDIFGGAIETLYSNPRNIHEVLRWADLVVGAVLVAGARAPKLVTREDLKLMSPGSVIVDLAAPNGGNVEGTVPGEVVDRHGVKILGETNLPALCAADASRMWARNVLGFAELLVNEGAIAPHWDDEIVKACCVTRDGEVVHEGARTAVGGGN